MGNKNKRANNEILQQVYAILGEKCFYCSQKVLFPYITIDHFYPRSKGNYNLRKNFVFACGYCNSHKQSLTLEGFKVRMEKELELYLERDNVKGREVLASGQKRKINKWNSIISTCTDLLNYPNKITEKLEEIHNNYRSLKNKHRSFLG